MKGKFNSFEQWLADAGVNWKSVTAGWCFLDVLFYTSTPFHDYVMGAYGKLPEGLHAFVAGVAVPVLLLWNARKKTTRQEFPDAGGKSLEPASAPQGKTPCE